MRIGINAHLLSKHAGYRTAGIHGYIYHLLSHLPDAMPDDWSATVMVGASNTSKFNGLEMRRARFDTDSPVKRILWEQLSQPWQLTEFDLYHALAFVSPFVQLTPSVVTVYDLSFVHFPQVLSTGRRLYLRLFTALSCQRARRVIAISQSTARDLETTLKIPAEKIDVAACGYDAEHFKPLPREAIQAFKQAKGLPERFWFFVGTLEPRKNLTALIEAYARLKDRPPLIIGGGKGWLYDDIFAAVERHHLEQEISFVGYITSDELPLWYNSAEVFLFPSIFEGFGLPVLEAMACGTPVIVSDASSLPEVVGQTGTTIPPHDIEAWANALHRAYTDKQWREAASHHGRLEARRYNWTDTAQQTIKSYQKALEITRR